MSTHPLGRGGVVTRDRGTRILCAVWTVTFLTAGVFAQTPTSDEDVARRQLDSGRSFARQGNFTEALKDFRAVADTHPSSSVADNALLEVARYFLDVVGDSKQAGEAVEGILKKYATSDSAPEAYLMQGRLALARSHQPSDLETALANFDRVSRLFPLSDAVPGSLVMAGEAFWYSGRFADARANLARVEVEYPTSPAAANAYLNAGRVLVSLGDPISAMEELQQVRNRWPNSPEANTALGRITLLYRLYVRTRAGGVAFSASADAVGPAKVDNVAGLVATGRNAVYWAGDSGTGVVAPANADKAPAATKPRGLAVDTTGALVILDGGTLKVPAGNPLALSVPRPNDTAELFSKIDAAVQLSNGEWLVMDGDQRALQKFSRTGESLGPFATTKASRLAINAVDEVASLDRDAKGIVLLDGTGKPLGKIPFKGVGYDFQNPVDLTYDTFGHLYLLDREALAVFSPYAAPGAAAAPPAAGRGSAAGTAPTGRGAAYRLLTVYTEPEKSPGAFRKATAFAVDQAGAVYLFDENAHRIKVYR